MAGGGIVLIEVDGGDYRLENFLEDGIALFAAAAAFPFAEGDIVAKGEAAGGLGQGFPADEGGAAFGEFALVDQRQVAVEFVGDDQFQDGVAEELHPLVGSQVGAAALVEKGTVNQGLP